jgi:hypothetical protein
MGLRKFAGLMYLLAVSNQQMTAGLFVAHSIHFLKNDHWEIFSLSFLEFGCCFGFNYFPIFEFPFARLTNLYFIILHLYLIESNFLMNFLRSKNYYLSLINFFFNCYFKGSKKSFNKMLLRHLIYFITNNCYYFEY